jgi:DNA modification methylase
MILRKHLNKVICGDALETLKKFPSASIDCAIFSPPYWQMRNYKWKGQWGREKSFEEYLERLWRFIDELKRVLKEQGTVWVNIGDTYGKLPAKTLLLIPHRFAIGCQERGWLIRNDIVWAKPNGMPESVKDRFSKKHEYIFFLTKSKKYYFDLDSVREQHKAASFERLQQEVSENNKWATGAGGQSMQGLSQPRPHVTKIIKIDAEQYGSPRARYHRGDGTVRSLHPKGKNPGDVSDFWSISTKPNFQKHFASYNYELINKPILAGCPKNGIVLDPFCGIATTGVRAVELERKFIGIEGKKSYCKMAMKNITAAEKLSVKKHNHERRHFSIYKRTA